MENASFTTFILLNFKPMEQQKYLYFTFFLVPYILSIILNTCLIIVVYKEHYHEKMSPRKVKILIAVAWLFPFSTFAMYLSLTIRLSFCSNVLHKTHCTNFELVRLSCTDTTLHGIIGILLMGVYMFPQISVILFSYVQILRICIHASKECQKKALQTCIPHLFTCLNYFFGWSFEFIQARMKASQTPAGVAIFMSLYFLILPPILNPVVYGSSALKVHIYQFLQRRKPSPV